MVGTLFLMIFFFKFHGQIETVHVCNRATCFIPLHCVLVIKVYLNGG